MSSLQERLAARREQLYQERTFVIPVEGYEDVGLFCRYRVLPYEEWRKIGKNNEKLADTAEGEVGVAADTLIRACVNFVERKDDGTFTDLEYRWNSGGVAALFGIDLPSEGGARGAVQAALPSNQLMLHYAAYSDAASTVVPAVDEEMAEGESEPSTEG